MLEALATSFDLGEDALDACGPGVGHRFIVPCREELVDGTLKDPSGTSISSQYGKVTIERDRMRINEKDWVPIATGLPIEFYIGKGKIWSAAGAATRIEIAGGDL